MTSKCFKKHTSGTSIGVTQTLVAKVEIYFSRAAKIGKSSSFSSEIKTVKKVAFLYVKATVSKFLETLNVLRRSSAACQLGNTSSRMITEVKQQ